MKKFCICIAVLVGLLGSATAGLAQQSGVMDEFKEMREKVVQKQQNTRAEIEQLNNQIQKYEQRLKQADEKYESLYSKYQNLKNLIALQDQKLKKLQREQSQIKEEISVTTQSLEKKQEQLTQLIENYKETLDYLYKHGRTSQLALIFSSSSVNQMLVRAFYLEKFNNYREQQVQEIRDTEKELKQTKQQLEQAQKKNKQVLAEIQQQKQQLAQKKQQQERNVELLRENREEIKQNLKQVQQQKKELNSTLTELSRKEKEIRQAQEQRLQQLEQERKKKLAAAKNIEDDAKRAREVKKYSEPIKMENFVDAEKMEKIEKRFAGNKGNLPWPVDSRTIAEHFGNKRHPVYGTVTPNLGIEIVTDPESSVKVVHDGYVIDVLPVPSYGDVVFVKHGHFITAYGNLSQITVRKSQVLEQGDVIGFSGDSDSPKGESLFFLIRKNNQNLDPEKWLQNETVSSNY
ncbi:MAG: peptidoglycan DD-metalloendopeptidase family protein [Fodinibius sp.]|nr:peptidoglycan DD-metalloendopeptidase family protein [Fodinibius sp.]